MAWYVDLVDAVGNVNVTGSDVATGEVPVLVPMTAVKVCGGATLTTVAVQLVPYPHEPRTDPPAPRITMKYGLDPTA
jgi:hypothetical protein